MYSVVAGLRAGDTSFCFGMLSGNNLRYGIYKFIVIIQSSYCRLYLNLGLYAHSFGSQYNIGSVYIVYVSLLFRRLTLFIVELGWSRKLPKFILQWWRFSFHDSQQKYRALGSKRGKYMIKCPIYSTLSFRCVYMCKTRQTWIRLTLKRVLGTFFVAFSDREEILCWLK